MKRLLLPLLAALTFPTVLISGDLGSADIDDERLKGIIADVDFYPKKIKGYKGLNEIACGMQNYNAGRKASLKNQNLIPENLEKSDINEFGLDLKMTKLCSLSFEDNLFKVDNSKGIKAQQVRDFYIYVPYDALTVLNIIYENSEEKLTRSEISFYRASRANPIFQQFMKRFLKFLNEEN